MEQKLESVLAKEKRGKAVGFSTGMISHTLVEILSIKSVKLLQVLLSRLLQTSIKLLKRELIRLSELEVLKSKELLQKLYEEQSKKYTKHHSGY